MFKNSHVHDAHVVVSTLGPRSVYRNFFLFILRLNQIWVKQNDSKCVNHRCEINRGHQVIKSVRKRVFATFHDAGGRIALIHSL
jgi:hypothetical protein